VRLLTSRRPAGSAGGAASARAAAPSARRTAYDRPAWTDGATGRGVRVAVVDSGWDRDQPDARVLPGTAIGMAAGGVRLAGDDRDRIGHGTGATHQVLAVAPECRVLPVRVFDGVLETSPGALVAALDWAVGQGARVVNLSLGTEREDAVRPLYAACERARRAGVVVVAAGGNFGETCYPAVFDPVIGVAMARFRSPFEFRYRAADALEVEAWGVRQPVPGLGGRVAVTTGTSVAAPNVAGIVALLLERHPGAGVEQVRELLAERAIG
jgi:subtilisin family serine protease